MITINHNPVFFGSVMIALSGWVAYHNSLEVPFLYDDRACILENRSLDSLFPPGNAVPNGLKRRPVGRWSLTLNHALGGFHVGGYHVLNLLIHVIAALFLFGLLRRTLALSPTGSPEERTSLGLALAMTLFWVVHPLQTQAVTYVIQRLESLMAMFYLATIYLVLRGTQAKHPWCWYALAVISCALGMGTKEVFATAPLVILLYDRIFLAESWRSLFRQRWGMYGLFFLAVTFLSFTLIPSFSEENNPGAGFGFEGITAYQYLTAQAGVLVHYLHLSLWPEPLCLDYAWPTTKMLTAILLPGSIVISLLATSLWGLVHWPRLGFLGISFFLILAPTSSFMPIADLAYEHRMYLPLATVITLLVIWGHRFVLRWQARPHWLCVAMTLLITLILTWLTVERNRKYSSRRSLWRSVVTTAPHNPRGHNHLGLELESVDPVRAAYHYRCAIELRPDYAVAHNNLGVLLQNQGDRSAAVYHFLQAVKIGQDFVEAHYNLGKFLTMENRFGQANLYLRRAVELQPDLPQIRIAWGMALMGQNQLSQAHNQFRKSLHLDPDNANTYTLLATVLARQGKLKKSAQHYRRAIELVPDLAAAHHNLGVVLKASGRLNEAQKHFEKAASLQKSNLPP